MKVFNVLGKLFENEIFKNIFWSIIISLVLIILIYYSVRYPMIRAYPSIYDEKIIDNDCLILLSNNHCSFIQKDSSALLTYDIEKYVNGSLDYFCVNTSGDVFRTIITEYKIRSQCERRIE